MGLPAEGKITHRYHVLFIDTRNRAAGEKSTTVLLTEGYTTFEDLRKIITVRLGGTVNDVDVLSVTRLHPPGPAE